MSVLIKGMETPSCCDDCWALDDFGDYPVCRITGEQRGYNFRTREKRMDKCPLVPVPPHGRLIDRQAAIDAVEFGITFAKAFKSTGEVKELFTEGNKALKEAVERLKAVPAAQPERKEAKWVRWWEVKDDGFGGEIYTPHWKCGECGTEYLPHRASLVRYCMRCGCKMEAVE